MSAIQNSIDLIHKDVRKAAVGVGRSADDVCIVAVTKKQPDARIEEALDCGLRVFGENRVQEAKERWEGRKSDHPDIRLHLIGPLQTNKVKDAVALFDVIETVDRPKLVHALAQEMKKQGRDIPCLIQVNTGQEEQKAGVHPDELDDLITLCVEEGLHVDGLMCIPPADDPAGLHFAFLKHLADQYNLKTLSMGMSGDYKIAIEAGATHIRIGTLLLGNRQY